VDVFEHISAGRKAGLLGLQFGRGEALFALLLDFAVDLGFAFLVDALGVGLGVGDELLGALVGLVPNFVGTRAGLVSDVLYDCF
jgi:hypothetical protein